MNVIMSELKYSGPQVWLHSSKNLFSHFVPRVTVKRSAIKWSFGFNTFENCNESIAENSDLRGRRILNLKFPHSEFLTKGPLNVLQNEEKGLSVKELSVRSFLKILWSLRRSLRFSFYGSRSIRDALDNENFRPAIKFCAKRCLSAADWA